MILVAPEDEHSLLVYFIPALDSMEKFDAYFSKVFTESTLEFVKESFGIQEIEGKLAGHHLGYRMDGSSLTDWENSPVVEVNQTDGSNRATAVFQVIDIIEGNVWGNREFEFEFSDKYGWRIDLKKYEERYEWII